MAGSGKNGVASLFSRGWIIGNDRYLVLGLGSWVGNFGRKAQYHQMVVRIELMWPYVFNSKLFNCNVFNTKATSYSQDQDPDLRPKTQDQKVSIFQNDCKPMSYN